MRSDDTTLETTGNRRTRKVSLFAAGTGALVTAVLLLWALYWPANDCDHPSCARKRYSVALEIDALGQIEPISFEVSEPSSAASLTEILRGGGIEVTPSINQVGLPYDPASGPLDRADLFQLVSAWRNSAAQRTDATLYALFVNALIADNGEELFGVMFDTAGREGFAVAPRTIERFFRDNEPALIPTLQLRTFAHELLHALNRDHTDAGQTPDGRLTLEAPTRCISVKQKVGWSLREPPLMALSPKTILFFQTAAARDVLPGPSNTPFINRRASATECDDARAHVIDPQEGSRWATALQRLRLLIGLTSAEAAEADADPNPPSVDIRIQGQPAAYPLGYPIAIRVMVTNTSEEALPLVGRLNPRYGMLMVEHRRRGVEDWQALQPMAFFEPTNDENAMLQPGARTEETVPIYYGEDGWTFEMAGDYEVRVRLQLGASGQEGISEPIPISVVGPSTSDDRNALLPLLDADGELAKQTGRLLYFGGRIGDQDDIEPLERTADQFGHTAVGGALRLTLLSQRIRKPIDPATGIRPPPDYEEARELIDDTCTDSGVAAMSSDVLDQRAAALPETLRTRAGSDTAAWEGITGSRTTIPTYSDPTLQPTGPSLHFCFNEAELRRSTREAVSTLARQLRRARPSRIVLVGHSDSAGTCRYNDALALRRARMVQRALVAAGLRRTPIEVVSVGERRPMSFASSSEAQQLNRRVEILVDGITPAGPGGNVIPNCPAEHRRPGSQVQSVMNDTIVSGSQ